MKCMKCGWNYEGPFCPNCGTVNRPDTNTQNEISAGTNGVPNPYGNPQDEAPAGTNGVPNPYGNPPYGAPYGNPQNNAPYGNPRAGEPYGNPQQPGVPGNYPVPAGRVPVRNIGTCIVFSIITLGIYSLYWCYMLNEDTAKATGQPKIVDGGMLILLTIVTCGLYTLYWYYKIGEMMDRARSARGEITGSLSLVYLLLAFFRLGIVSDCLIQSDLNKWMEQ